VRQLHSAAEEAGLQQTRKGNGDLIRTEESAVFEHRRKDTRSRGRRSHHFERLSTIGCV